MSDEIAFDCVTQSKACTTSPFIVSEIVKWHDDCRIETIADFFAKEIQTNFEKGYELHSWAMTSATSKQRDAVPVTVETIVAVFRKSQPSSSR